MQSPHRTFTPAELESEVWGEELPDSDTLRTHIYTLRRALRGPGEMDVIETLHGVGTASWRVVMMRNSRRFKVALFFSVLTIALLVAQALGVRALAEAQEERLIAALVRDDMASVLKSYNANPAVLPPFNVRLNGYVSGADRESIVLPETVRNRPVSDFVQEAQARENREIRMWSGTYAVFSGASEARAQSQRDLLAYGGIALVGIALPLFLAMKNRRAVALVMINLPFALVGGVLGVVLTGANLSLGGMVGLVTLLGISLRNSIMLISHFEHLVHVDGLSWNMDTAVRGASERLVPILMTALVTALALAPLAVTSGAAGNEIEGPMAMVILGGLITSTALNLIVLLRLALRYGRFARDEAAERGTANA